MEKTKRIDERAEIERRFAPHPGEIDTKDPARYDNLPPAALAMLCRMKDKSNNIFVRRYEAARTVIDIMARRIGMNPDNCGLFLYAPDGENDEDCHIARRLNELLDRSGDKVKLKKRVEELEAENRVLRSLIQK